MSAERYIDSISDRRNKAPVEVVEEWLQEPDTKLGLQLCADAAIEAIRNDANLRVPRTEALRRNGFAQWLALWKQRLGPAMEQQFRREFPGISQHLKPGLIDDVVSNEVWPKVEPELVSYAVHGLGNGWAGRHLGDAIILCEPRQEQGAWIIPLQPKQGDRNVGQIVLDKEGNVIPDRTSSHDDVLKSLNA